VYEHARKGELTVTLGGDHSLAMGTVSGTFKAFPEAALIWVDAHAVRPCFSSHFPSQRVVLKFDSTGHQHSFNDSLWKLARLSRLVLDGSPRYFEGGDP